MKVLITGASGFVASYLIPELQVAGHELILSAPGSHALDHSPFANLPFIPCDITRVSEVEALVMESRPDAIVHLGGKAHVGKAEDPQGRADLSNVNVVATHHLCAAASQLPQVTFLFISSAFVYGGSGSRLVCDEQTPLRPNTAYGFSKLAAEAVVQSFRTERFRSYCVRPFNHIGPGQHPDFVCTAFARRVFNAANGSTIQVGNLSAERDFSDVRDIVKAYRKILDTAPDESVFVLGRGQTVTIQWILDRFIAMSGKRLSVEVDPGLLRSDGEQVRVANCGLAKRILGWTPDIPVERSLEDIYRSVSNNASRNFL